MIDYIDSSHTYLNSDGIIIPSVSKLIQHATGDSYNSIPKSILRQAQEFGTDIHKAIEMYLTSRIATKFDGAMYNLAFSEFLRIYKEHIGNNPVCETMVDYEERYAGRIDCLSGTTLIDFKTNTKLNTRHLEWQFGFYKMALESKGVQIDKCMCLWLPKRKSGKWVEITPKSKEECLKVLEDYENNCRED